MGVCGADRRTFNPLVAGPIPARPTNKYKGLQAILQPLIFWFLGTFGHATFQTVFLIYLKDLVGPRLASMTPSGIRE